ncbi:MAG: hypothetical protein K6F31_06885 [Acetatifactor sp.]|nr:hypothetical protein [Acetatifactor sp.]
MIGVMISNCILFLLTIAAAYFSGHVTLALALGGGLMIAVTAGFVTDGGEKLLKLTQLFLAVFFAFCTGQWWGCIVFAMLLWPKAWQVVACADAAYALIVGARLLQGGAEASEGAHAMGHLIATGLVELALLDLSLLGILLCRHAFQASRQQKEADRMRMQNYSLSELHEIQKNKELMRQSFFAEKNARLVERENISRNIHNSVGHSITAAIMTLDAADMLFDKKPEEAHKRMNDATERIRGSLGAIRSAVRALDAESEDISVKDLICYFDNILNEFLMDTERTCDRLYDITSEEYSLPREHAEFLTGALSELLTNGVKHGQATHFIVRLSGDKAHIRLDVADNGSSAFDEQSSAELIRNGFGLKKLTSYAERCGGSTAFYNDNGFHSSIELPI